jgi:hypothetical protein
MWWVADRLDDPSLGSEQIHHSCNRLQNKSTHPSKLLGVKAATLQEPAVLHAAQSVAVNSNLGKHKCPSDLAGEMKLLI